MSFTELVKHNECWRDVVAGRPRQWKKGYKFADDTARMYFLVSGRVRLVALAADGGEKPSGIWAMGAALMKRRFLRTIKRKILSGREMQDFIMSAWKTAICTHLPCRT
ncbi:MULTISPECIES: hypothetical protein [Desulfovibrio]|uniref:hypothetical protein n=1 Tax=Desulfovibrio TaxID=872 RepID=UPI0011609681|nr:MULTISPECIES: hypothetical protein [Desulfovibrio]